MDSKLFFSTIALILLSVFSAHAADPTPPLAEIIRQVVARDDANQKALLSIEYHESLRTEQLDSQGRVTKKQVVQMLVRPGAIEEMKVLSAKGDNLPSDPDEAIRQAKGQAAQSKKINFALKDMAGRFHISFAGTDTFEGQSVYVMAFEPKPNQPYRDQTEKVLNHLHGKMWISTKDYSVLKTEASLAKPVNIAWIFVQVSSVDFHYELRNTTGAMGPATIQTFVTVSAPFFALRQRMTVDMTQFRPRPDHLSEKK